MSLQVRHRLATYVVQCIRIRALVHQHIDDPGFPLMSGVMQGSVTILSLHRMVSKEGKYAVVSAIADVAIKFVSIIDRLQMTICISFRISIRISITFVQ